MAQIGRPVRVQSSPHIGEILQERRRELALSPSELAAACGVSTNTLMKVEQGVTVDPGVLKVALVCGALRMSVDALVAAVGHRESRSETLSLVSLGYEGRAVDELIGEVSLLGVQVVADVRLNPISRKQGLSKTKLSAALAAAGIDYVHYKRLGNPKTNREPFWNGRPDVGRKRLRLMFGPEAWADLAELRELATTRVVGVLCFEADEERCHRKLILDELRAGPQRLG